MIQDPRTDSCSTLTRISLNETELMHSELEKESASVQYTHYFMCFISLFVYVHIFCAQKPLLSALKNPDSYCFRAAVGEEHLCKWLLKYCNICSNTAPTLKHSRPLYFVRWLTLLRGMLLTWKLQKLCKNTFTVTEKRHEFLPVYFFFNLQSSTDAS